MREFDKESLQFPSVIISLIFIVSSFDDVRRKFKLVILAGKGVKKTGLSNVNTPLFGVTPSLLHSCF